MMRAGSRAGAKTGARAPTATRALPWEARWPRVPVSGPPRVLCCTGSERERLRDWQLRQGHGLDEDAPVGAGLVARPGGQDGVEDLAPAAEVVVGHPAREAEQLFGEQRLLVEDGQDGLGGVGGA